MGHGIAQVFALAGHLVTVHAPSVDALMSLRDRVRRNLIDLRQDASAADRVHPVERLAGCVASADVVFEAGHENLALKRQLFAELETLVLAHCTLASNTSVIPITDIMRGLKTGPRALGTHWWNPPHLVPLVEVIKTVETDAAVARAMFDLLAGRSRTPTWWASSSRLRSTRPCCRPSTAHRARRPTSRG